MPRLDPLRLALLLGALPLLTGCELAAAGFLMPGFLPGTGLPLTGTVLDARTRLPIGGATVVSGLGSTLTDASGQFRLYGSFASKEVSVSRAGYVAMTLGGLQPERSGPLEFALDPIFSNGSPLPKRFLNLKGRVSVQGSLISDGLACFGGKQSNISNGGYQILFEEQAPGKVYTGVLAGGRLSQRYNEAAVPPQTFSFIPNTFGFRLVSWGLGETLNAPEAQVTQGDLDIKGDIPFQKVNVNYTNLGTLSQVQTDILLDFGVAGAVPVARATSSNQELTVPAIGGLKYVVNGRAQDSTGRQASTVNITTNNPSQAPFQLLSVPKILSPAAGAKGVGARPSFSWTPSTAPGVVYIVKLYEGEDTSAAATAKWVARTTDPFVSYPAFSPSDVNAGALRTEMKYTWSLRVVDVLAATEQPGSFKDAVPFQPFRVREREASVSGNQFTP